MKLAEHRYSYVKKVDGIDVYIKPDSTFYDSYDPVSNRINVIERKNSEMANIFEEAEYFLFQSAIVERDRKVALLGVNGQYVFPFDYGEGETLYSSFDKLDDNCLVYRRTYKNSNNNDVVDSETKIINRDGHVLYDGFIRDNRIENGHLVLLDGHYRMEIDLDSAKVIFPFCLTHFKFENGAMLFFSRKKGQGWNVYDPSRQKVLFERYYGSIVYLDKQNSYLVNDGKTIGIADLNGTIIRELPKGEIKYIYDQRYFYGDYCLYDFDGKEIIGWQYHIRKVLYNEDESRETIWWSTYIDSKETPQEPPFARMDKGEILFFLCSAGFCDSIIDLQGKTILGPINPGIDDEYDKETHKLIGFANFEPWSKTWKHYSLDGKFICENSVIPSPPKKSTIHHVNQVTNNNKSSLQTGLSFVETREKKLLFFDTETTGLPRNYKAPVSDLENWPRLVQLSWIVTDSTGTEKRVKDFIIKPDGFTIPEDSSKVHGITTEIAKREGSLLQNVLAEFVSDLESADVVIGHNVDFDKKVVGAEFIRCNIGSKALNKPTVCTMKSSTDYCALPGKYGYKWPTLQELHNKLFGESFEDAHNSLNDIKATKKCYFELKKRNII